MVQRKGFIACILVAVFLLTACASGKDDFFKVGEDQIPTLYTVAGNKKVVSTNSGFENGNSYKVVSYADVTPEEMQLYIDALEGIGYAQVQETEVSEAGVQTLTLGNNSVTDGKIILVRIQLNPEGETIVQYNVNDGTIEYNSSMQE